MKKIFLIVLALILTCILILLLTIYSIKTDKTNTEIINIDTFYKSEVIGNYKDVRKLKKDYSIEDAKKDKCYIPSYKYDYNLKVYEEFIKEYNNKEKSFIRVALPTDEGDLILYDILYDGNKVYTVIDSTRDRYSSSINRNVDFQIFDSLIEYKDNSGSIWVILYNGEFKGEYQLALYSSIGFKINKK